MIRLPSTALAIALAAALPLGAATVEVDAKLPEHKVVAGISGTMNSIGSDTLNNLMARWTEGFNAKYPNVKIQVEGKGSSTAPPALIEGTAQLGPMSREMKKEEIDKFEAKFGYKPTAITVAVDALAVFVHKDSPVDVLSLAQVDSLFGENLKRGGKSITDWGDIVPAMKGTAVSLYGRNSASGTYGFFKEHALKNGAYKSSVKEQPGSSAVVSGVAGDAGGVGYSGIGYLTSSVKAVKLTEKDGGPGVAPSYENCLNATYPMWRFLIIYVNKDPKKAMDPLTLEFIRYVTSKEGQQIVVKDGYFPVPAAVVEQTLKSVAP